MARIHVVKKARKAPGNCSVCFKPIEIGTSYKWAAPRAGKFARGHKVKAHDHCQFRPSQLTTSEIKGAIYDAIETAENDISGWDGESLEDLKGILESAAESIKEAADNAREKAENIESGFGHSTATSDELTERADAIESFADEVTSAGDNIDEFDEDATIAEVESELGTFEEWALKEYGEDVKPADWDRERYDEAIKTEVEGKKDEWIENARSEASDALGNSPEGDAVILYHWTNIKWLEMIIASGVVMTTESNLCGPQPGEAPKAARKRFASRWTHESEPQVVWLSNNPVVDPTYLGMIDVRSDVPRMVTAQMLPPEYRKTRVRITVDVPDAAVHWWPRWSRKMGIREAWYQQLAEGHRSPKEWFVVTRPIPMSEFVAIHIDDQQVWPKEQAALQTFVASLSKGLVDLLGKVKV
jgi:hypothetical protein